MPQAKAELIAMAKRAAMDHLLPPDLVCAVIEQESNWDPWAIRYEPGFEARYLSKLPDLSETESHARATSWGLMQVMGQVAREQGFSGPSLAELLDPAVNIDQGCRKLADCWVPNSDAATALEKYNGGGDPNYAAQVMARRPNYV